MRSASLEPRQHLNSLTLIDLEIPMARVPYLTEADLEPDNRDLLARNINLYRALVHSPNTARQFGALGMHIRYEMTLDPRLRELAILQVGYMARAPYEYAHHIEIGRRVGVTDDDVRAIATESAGGTSALPLLDRTVLLAARELSAAPALNDDTYTTLSEHLDNEMLVDLITSIAFYCGVVRVLGALQIDVEDDCLHYLEEFPFAPE
jgi:alkylhydroperoxidase family enzyme